MFTVGAHYDRSKLLNHVGSRQPQSGVIWGQARTDCLIATSGGRYGARMGYADHRLPDGTWLYHGQGERGNHDPTSFANAMLLAGDRSVLLFTTREPTAAEVKARNSYAKVYRYEGSFAVASWDYTIPQDGKRAGDKLLVFRLVPDGMYALPVGEEALPVNPLPIDGEPSARRDQLLASPFKPPKGASSIAHYFIRSEQVHRYALLRAEGRCECCNSAAPFVDENLNPFLEVHHIDRLADSGPDHPLNVAAVCPNCHRWVHHGHDAAKANAELRLRIREKESRSGGNVMEHCQGHGDPNS